MDFLSGGRLVYRNIFGHYFYLNNVRNYIERRIFRRGIFDHDCIFVMRALLKQMKNPVVFDVGANIGNHALSMAPLSQMVYCFDPSEFTNPYLQQNIYINQMHNVKPFSFGLGRQNLRSKFYICRDNPGGSGFNNQYSKKTRKFTVEETQAEIRKGDEFVEQNNIQQIDLIKIDVEGFELDVIHGMAGAITRCRPIIFMEWDKAEVKRRFFSENILQTVLKNYDIFAINDNYYRDFLRGKPLKALKHYAAKKRGLKTVALSAFVPDRTYRNIILFPKEKRYQLAGLDRQALY